MKAENISATLVAHRGAVKVERGALLSLVTPPRTLTHRPVAHSEVIDYIEQRLDDHGMVIERGEYAVMSDGMKLFAALVLRHQLDDFAFALGLRSSNDKSMAMELVAGCRVFCCDNMALSGEADVLCRKHTSQLNPRLEIFGGVDRAIAKFTVLGQRIGGLKSIKISDNEAKAKIYDAVAQGIILPKYATVVGKEYFEPKHEEFRPRTAWSLHNAFTEMFKLLPPNQVIDSSQALGTMFAI
jgi:hypothetical protein